MWWSRRACIALPAVLTACGYTPVYGPSQSSAVAPGNIIVEAPNTRDEFLLVQHLERRLGRSDVPEYRLDHALNVRSDELAISITGARARYNLVGILSISLVDMSTGQVVLSERLEDFTAYSAAGTTIATFAAEQDARERLMVVLGDRTATRIFAAELP
ncbi:MAG: LPS assembly lipoprotein LptE [Pseudomonadota bacterium]